MSEHIYYSPREVWGLFSPCYDDETIIAENDNTGTTIYAITNKNIPYIVATFVDSEPISTMVDSENDCEYIVEEMYSLYLGDIYEDVEERSSEEIEIRERENELNTATWEYVFDVISMSTYDIDDDIISDIKERFLEILYTEFDIEPYRPMYLIDESTGNELFKERPYSLLY